MEIVPIYIQTFVNWYKKDDRIFFYSGSYPYSTRHYCCRVHISVSKQVTTTSHFSYSPSSVVCLLSLLVFLSNFLPSMLWRKKLIFVTKKCLFKTTTNKQKSAFKYVIPAIICLELKFWKTQIKCIHTEIKVWCTVRLPT